MLKWRGDWEYRTEDKAGGQLTLKIFEKAIWFTFTHTKMHTNIHTNTHTV